MPALTGTVKALDHYHGHKEHHFTNQPEVVNLAVVVNFTSQHEMLHRYYCFVKQSYIVSLMLHLCFCEGQASTVMHHYLIFYILTF